MAERTTMDVEAKIRQEKSNVTQGSVKGFKND